MSRVLVEATVVENGPYDGRYYYLELSAPEVARQFESGQFIMVRCAPPGSLDPLLPRPFTPVRADAGAGRLGLLYTPAGRGRGWLAERRPGDRLAVWGPLGRGYQVGTGGPALLVGSGRHLAALFPLAHRLAALGIDSRLIGLTDRPDSAANPIAPDLGLELRPLTGVDWGAAAQVFLAGSPELYRLAARTLPADLLTRVQVLVEAPMACGVGVCLGCTVWTEQGPARACADGPVFTLADIRWI